MTFDQVLASPVWWIVSTIVVGLFLNLAGVLLYKLLEGWMGSLSSSVRNRTARAAKRREDRIAALMRSSALRSQLITVCTIFAFLVISMSVLYVPVFLTSLMRPDLLVPIHRFVFAVCLALPLLVVVSGALIGNMLRYLLAAYSRLAEADKLEDLIGPR